MVYSGELFECIACGRADTHDCAHAPRLTEPVVSVTQASDLAARMFNDLTMIPDEERRRLRMRTIRICEDIQECVELMGKTPKTIAATVIYVVLEKTGYTTKATISTVCGVSAPTINKIEDIVKLKISGAN